MTAAVIIAFVLGFGVGATLLFFDMRGQTERADEVTNVLRAERDSFWRSGEEIRQEALLTEARKNEQIAALQAELKRRTTPASPPEPLAIWKVTTVHVKPKKQPKKSAPKIGKGAKKK